MIDLNSEAHKPYVIFGIEPKRYQAVARAINTLPHKYVVGTSDKGPVELSVVMPYESFKLHEDYLMQGQTWYLLLEPAKRNGTRQAFSIFNRNEGYSGKEMPHHLGDFVEIMKPEPDEDYTYDFETGRYYGIRKA